MGRHALLIGVSEFADERLKRLNAPINDVERLKGVLADKSRGGFDSVELGLNEDFLATRDRLWQFFHDRSPDDTLLLYYSGHGILGRGNRLFLATRESDLDQPSRRSLSAQEVQDFIGECRALQQIILMDCCHSGAFAEFGKAGAPPPAVTAETFATEGTGLYVLTAADRLQNAWDGADLRQGDPEASLSQFTSWLVEGLENGEAAPDDEHITMDALYRFLSRRAHGSGMTPQRFFQGGGGDVVISANPLAGLSRLDPEIIADLAADRYRTRLGAVHELSLLINQDGATARAARLLLQQRFQQERDYLVRQAIDRALVEQASATSRAAVPAEVVIASSLVSAPATTTEASKEADSPSQPRDSERPDLEVFRDAPLAPEMIVIPVGEFWMGSSEEEEGRYDDEGPRHRVTIGQRFAIGRYPVTFEEYDRFCDAEQRKKPDDSGWGRGRRPVINVSWQDTRAYTAWLSRETGRAYRLASEAEWEYAGRAETETRYSFGDAIIPKDANYSESKLGQTSEVGAYPPNPWGLYDMHGNVWEWVEDDWHENYQGAPEDGSAWKGEGADSRSRLCVLRGGSWFEDPEACRTACRDWGNAGIRGSAVGFRVARTLS